MLPTVVATITAEDLNRYRAIVARCNGYTNHPEAYSAQEIEQNEMAYFRFHGELVQRFAIDCRRTWNVNVNTGEIMYSEDD